MPYLILGLALLLGLLLAARWLASAEPKKVASALKWSAAVLLVAAVGILFVRGQLGYLIALAGGLIPFILRWRGILQSVRNAAKAAQGPTRGQSSEIVTRLLSMRLDHDSGEMHGHVLEGPFRNRSLDTLSDAEMAALLSECHGADAQSAQVLEAYLDRMRGPDWRESFGAETASEEPRQPAGGSMTTDQAREILGVGPDATPQEIREAHRRLMLANHPDHGGSTYLAAQINRAKDVLLGKK
ncbi:DnaJ domain-containing protein [Oceanibaculum sp.]|uniref:DnaJ domain-containing protein n=1 Tax=Oceanibaculum sp. TaxID=1903597 RepID=UPI00258667F4|nr:DnaJ domain-containing protein [Oceanibaculum sp.]MCH2394053.1 DnaJ domain-containing protein [Oceanibaculum sp.]